VGYFSEGASLRDGMSSRGNTSAFFIRLSYYSYFKNSSAFFCKIIIGFNVLEKLSGFL
jgi:hypothetical protein